MTTFICNNHDTTEIRPTDSCAYEARRLREAILTGSVQKYTETDIFLDILKRNKEPMKREMLLNYFATREHCTFGCAEDLFNRVREDLLLSKGVVQPCHGYYCLEEYM